MSESESTTDAESELEALRAELAALRSEKDHLAQRNDLLQHRVKELERYLFGRRSERYIDHPELPFPGDEPEIETPAFAREAPDDEERDTGPKGKPRPRRGVPRLNADLPRVREVVPATDEERLCPDGCERTAIGEEVTEKLEYKPASFFIREIVRTKFACKQHEEYGVAIPDLPKEPIAKGMAGASLLAHVCTSKYKDHMPLHRQHGIYLRQGVDIAESTMVDWVRDVANLVDPIVQAIRQSLLSRDITSTDDTPICVLDPKQPKGSRSGFLWAYLGAPGEVVFDFTNGRSREGPRAFFGDYQGYIQADAYSGYNILFQDSGRTEVGCWAHARRRFHKALDGEHRHAKHAIAAIRMLYDTEVEATTGEMDPETRRELRRQKSAPVLESFRPWLEEVSRGVLPKSPMGKAIGYTLRQWTALTNFLLDGRLALDNNRCERAIRQVAIGRKNWMFAGSEAGAQRAAAIYSLIGGCIELKLDPFAYLTDAIARVARGDDPAGLTPLAWYSARS